MQDVQTHSSYFNHINVPLFTTYNPLIPLPPTDLRSLIKDLLPCLYFCLNCQYVKEDVLKCIVKEELININVA